MIYDHRSWGSSDGLPRAEYNMWRQAEDYNDAVTYVKTLKDEVDADKVMIWGIGHSGGIAIIAAADNPNIAGVIIVAPMISGSNDVQNFSPEIMQTAWKDRVENVGNHTSEPTYSQLWPVDKTMALAKDGTQSILNGEQIWDFASGCEQRSNVAGTEWSKKITAQSFYHISRVEPEDYIHRIAPRPLLYLVAATDVLTGTVERHREMFARAGQPKEFGVIDEHHLATYMYENKAFEDSAAKQISWVKAMFGS